MILLASAVVISLPYTGVEKAMKKWESKKNWVHPKNFCSCLHFQFAPHQSVAEPGVQSPNEEVGAPCTLGP